MSEPISQRRIMLISNSYCFGRGYLEHCAEAIGSFLGPRKRIVFVPFALQDWERYTAIARQAFQQMGCALLGIHESLVLGRFGQLAKVDAVFVGGGNTFRLLKGLYDHGATTVIRDLVDSGIPYLGASAGANVAGPSIKTTNDMPIVYPPSFDALGIVPFQINPHFVDADPGSKHMGETREKRIAEFHEEPGNDATVIGMREGSWITVEESVATLGGTSGAKLFMKGKPPTEWESSHPLTIG